MGSYKWGYKSIIWVSIMVALLIPPLITTHEPPSTGEPSSCLGFRGLRGFSGLTSLISALSYVGFSTGPS